MINRGILITTTFVLLISSCSKHSAKSHDGSNVINMIEELASIQRAYIGKNLGDVENHLKAGGEYSEVSIYAPANVADNVLFPTKVITSEGFDYLINSESIIIDVRYSGANPYKSPGGEIGKYLMK